MMSHAQSAWWLETKSYARRKPHALASTPATPKEKTHLAFLIWRGWIFSEKRKGCFSFGGFLPSKYSGSAAGQNAELGRLGRRGSRGGIPRCLRSKFFKIADENYSTVTDLAKFLGLSTSNPRLVPI